MPETDDDKPLAQGEFKAAVQTLMGRIDQVEKKIEHITPEFDEFLCELKENCDYINAIFDNMIATAVYYRKRGERRAKAMERSRSAKT